MERTEMYRHSIHGDRDAFPSAEDDEVQTMAHTTTHYTHYTHAQGIGCPIVKDWGIEPDTDSHRDRQRGAERWAWFDNQCGKR